MSERCAATLSGWHVWRVVRCSPLGESPWPTLEELEEEPHGSHCDCLRCLIEGGVTCQAFARCSCGAERVPSAREVRCWQAAEDAERFARLRVHLAAS